MKELQCLSQLRHEYHGSELRSRIESAVISQNDLEREMFPPNLQFGLLSPLLP